MKKTTLVLVALCGLAFTMPAQTISTYTNNMYPNSHQICATETNLFLYQLQIWNNDTNILTASTLSFHFSSPNISNVKLVINGNQYGTTGQLSGTNATVLLNYPLGANSYTSVWVYVDVAGSIGENIQCVFDSLSFVNSSLGILGTHTNTLSGPVMNIYSNCNTIANFTPSTTTLCQGGYVSFTDNTSGPVEHWQWYFSGGQNLNNWVGQTPPAVLFNYGGSFMVQLIVTDSFGYQDVQTQMINVNPNPQVSLTPYPQPQMCEGDTLTVHALCMPNIGNYTYNWTNYGIPMGVTSDSVHIVANGNYTVIATDQHGCSSIAQSMLTYFAPKPVPQLYVQDNNYNQGYLNWDTVKICGNPHTAYLASSSTIYAPYTIWNTGDSATSIGVNQPGLYQMEMVTQQGCRAGREVYIDFFPTPQISITTSPNPPLCEGDTLTLSATGGPYYCYNWEVTTDGVMQPFNTQTVDVYAGGIVNLTIQENNTAHCHYAIPTINIPFNPTPAQPSIVNQFACDLICTLTGPGMTYQWYGPNGIIPGATSQSYTVPDSGNHSVTVTSIAGCSATSSLFYFDCLTTGIKKVEVADTRILVYPNPASMEVVVSFGKEEGTAILYDLFGKVVATQKGRNTLSFNVASMARGTYMISLITKNKKEIQKVVLN